MSATLMNKKNTPTHKHSNIWGPFRLFDPTLRTFDARLGPSGISCISKLLNQSVIKYSFARQYERLFGNHRSPIHWFCMVHQRIPYPGVIFEARPNLCIQVSFKFRLFLDLFNIWSTVFIANHRVEGGKDPYSAEFYHPLVITSDPIGGYDRLNEEMVKWIQFWILVELLIMRNYVCRRKTLGSLLVLSSHEDCLQDPLPLADCAFGNTVKVPTVDWTITFRLLLIRSYFKSLNTFNQFILDLWEISQFFDAAMRRRRGSSSWGHSKCHVARWAKT